MHQNGFSTTTVNNCTVTILDLQENPEISNIGAKALASALVTNVSLQILNISGCHLLGY